MADSIKRNSRSKERSRSRTMNKNKNSKREHSIWSNSSDASESNVSIKRKSTSCSKDKRRKSRRYSRSSSSSSSSSSTSSNSTPRKENFKKSLKSIKKSSDPEIDKLSERKLNERSINEERKIIKEKKLSRSRSRSVNKNDDDDNKSRSHRRQIESCHKEEPHGRSTSKDQRSEREKLRIRTKDCYGDPYNSGVIKSSEDLSEHGKSNRVSISKIKNERDQESLKNNEERNSVSSVNYEGIKALKKTEDLSINKKSKGSIDHSISSIRNTGKKSKKKRSTSSSSSSSTSSSSSDDSKAEKARKKRKKIAARKLKKAEKKQKKKEKKLKKKLKKMKSKPLIKEEEIIRLDQSSSNDRLLNDIPMEVIERAKAMAPMTKEQWEKKQSIIRRVYDEETGRHRLIKGGGEVLEEIVSRERHRDINRQATRGDGEYFQSQLRLSK